MLQIPQPFKVLNGDSAGVCDEIGNDRDLPCFEHLGPLPSDWAIGSLRDDAALQLVAIVHIEFGLDSTGKQNIAGLVADIQWMELVINLGGVVVTVKRFVMRIIVVYCIQRVLQPFWLIDRPVLSRQTDNLRARFMEKLGRVKPTLPSSFTQII